jgi:hypothetical protein
VRRAVAGEGVTGVIGVQELQNVTTELWRFRLIPLSDLKALTRRYAEQAGTAYLQPKASCLRSR